MSEQYVLRLEIAVDDPVFVKEDEAGQELLCEAPNQSQREPLEIMRLDEFIQVHPKQVSRDTQVIPEVKALIKADHAVTILGVL